ncbi:efflux RND transporter periplasmic adaptor subunit [Maricaulis parjimensis]|uniref:efflux RND transporter periplasmic adaptor subunit n=1 Tax=Maricaulis parjimensis TaxID=144023 RepID=UPI00193950F6|nr:efflux RND transporter periplasmic adaptor subunit [Maricaulis parjimensis]
MTLRLSNLGVALSCACALAVSACGSDETAARSGASAGQERIRVVTQSVRFERERTDVESVGTARARATAQIYPETGGVVTAVPFSAGQHVEAGDLLLQLEDREERLAVNLARVAVQEAEQLLARYRRIEDTGAVSASQIDEARTALDSARIELEQAEIALEERAVRAPFAGNVGLTDIDPGSRVTASTAITQIDDRSVLYVDFEAAEQVFGYLAVGDSITVAPFANPDAVVEAEVVAVDSHINPTRRTFTVRALLDNASDGLRPGMSFRVNFTIFGQSYPRVPESAIIWGASGSYIWSVEDEQAVRVPVNIVSRLDGHVLVRGEISADARIITEGVQKVREGSLIDDLAADRSSVVTGGGPIAADETR